MFNVFHPSKVVQDLYNATDEALIAMDIYDSDIKNQIIQWFKTVYPEIEFKIISIETASTGGTVVVSWCENGYPQMETFNYWN